MSECDDGYCMATAVVPQLVTAGMGGGGVKRDGMRVRKRERELGHRGDKRKYISLRFWAYEKKENK